MTQDRAKQNGGSHSHRQHEQSVVSRETSRDRSKEGGQSDRQESDHHRSQRSRSALVSHNKDVTYLECSICVRGMPEEDNRSHLAHEFHA